MAVGNILALKVVGRCQDQNIVNTLHWAVEAQVAAEHEICAQLCEAFANDIQTAWLARHSVDYQLIGYKAHGVLGAAKVPGQKLVDTPGVVTGTTLPASVCRTITVYQTDLPNRHRGRIMLSGTDTLQLDSTDGGVTAAEVVLMQALADLIMAGISDAGDEFSFALWGVDLLENPDALPIAKLVARRTPASVTSRRIRELLIG